MRCGDCAGGETVGLIGYVPVTPLSVGFDHVTIQSQEICIKCASNAYINEPILQFYLARTPHEQKENWQKAKR